MKRIPRRLLALLVIAAGAYLFIYELRDYQSNQQGESWFWLAVALAAVLLGLVELFSRTPPKK